MCNPEPQRHMPGSREWWEMYHSKPNSVCQWCGQNYYYKGEPHCYAFSEEFNISGRGKIVMMNFPDINEKGLPFNIKDTIRVNKYGLCTVRGIEMMRGSFGIHRIVGVLITPKNKGNI